MSRIKKKKTGVQHISIDTAQADRRIDNFLASHLKGVPRARIYQMLRRGEVRVNGGRIRQDYRLQQGDVLRLPPVSLNPSPVKKPPPERLVNLVKRGILYEDNDLLVVNKPGGIAVHGGSGLSFGLIGVLRHIYSNIPDLQLIHRLDRDTSGILLCAKNRKCLLRIQQQLKDHRINKHYLALLIGKLQASSMEVNQPLEKNIQRSGERMVNVSETGKAAHTRFELRRRYHGATLVEATITTGRTHQIRVHAAAIGHPVAGDSKYGDKEANRIMKQRGLRRLFLHAARMELPDYHGKRTLVIEAPLPEDLKDVLEGL